MNDLTNNPYAASTLPAHLHGAVYEPHAGLVVASLVTPHRWFRRLWWWAAGVNTLAMIAGGAMFAVMFMALGVTPGQDPDPKVFESHMGATLLMGLFALLTGLTGFAGSALWVAAVVFAMVILHRLWTAVQPSQITTPGKAVGFLFIPFFNLVWCFTAWSGLARELGAPRRLIATGCWLWSIALGLYLISIVVSIAAGIVDHNEPNPLSSLSVISYVITGICMLFWVALIFIFPVMIKRLIAAAQARAAEVAS